MLTKICPFPVRRLVFIYALMMNVGLALFTALNGFAQVNLPLDTTDITRQPIFTAAEQAPEFVGGLNALREYLLANRQYPPAAKAVGVSGLVSTTFIIRRDGRITDVRVLQGLGHGCDEEAVRLIKAMPNWQPARQVGRPVNFEQKLAISFGRVLYAARPTSTDPDSIRKEEIFTVCEQAPVFSGGMGALQKYLRKNLQYPPAAKAAGVNGRVFIAFIVRNAGQVTDIQVLKGLGYGCDEEAVRVVSNMPNWQPGKQLGRPVNVKYNLPIQFGR